MRCHTRRQSAQESASVRKTCMTLITIIFMLGVAMLHAGFASGEPAGVIVVSNTTVTPAQQPAATITTTGGSFTTMLLNATTQTMRWKAYVGNVTGTFKLQDASNFTLYDWAITTVAGEIYASRNNTINWADIRCAVNSTLGAEQTQLNITTSKDDSINRTFNASVHRSFYVGTKLITNSSCRAIATFVNGTRQTASESASFQEVLLDDTQRIVYTTLLENKARGYNNQSFDFQMIVAESDINPTPSPYYFWAELS
ncbi:TPA: hypothetical protein HA251_03000 [Candidatus Woesearchaeota archaeon]|nr:hypothetical protein [Candidatus Woesearchaeota archaeon]